MANPDPSPATRFAPGTSGNASGKRKLQWAGLRERISELTNDGRDLVDFAVEVYQGRMPGQAKAPNERVRMEAFIWLAERFWGKAIQPIDMTTHQGAPSPGLTPEIMSKLTKEELDIMERVGGLMLAQQAAGAVIDVEG